MVEPQAAAVQHTSTSGVVRKEVEARAPKVTHHPGLAFPLVGQPQMRREKEWKSTTRSYSFFLMGQAQFNVYKEGGFRVKMRALNLGPTQLSSNINKVLPIRRGHHSGGCTVQPKSLQVQETLSKGRGLYPTEEVKSILYTFSKGILEETPCTCLVINPCTPHLEDIVDLLVGGVLLGYQVS